MAIAKDVHVKEITKHLTIRVRGLKGFGFRTRLAGLLLRFGGWVAGTKVDVELADAHVIRRLDLGYRDILVVRLQRAPLSADDVTRASSHFREILDAAGRPDVKLLILDGTASIEVLAARSEVGGGFQPATGWRAPDNPPNQGSAGRRPPPSTNV